VKWTRLRVELQNNSALAIINRWMLEKHFTKAFCEDSFNDTFASEQKIFSFFDETDARASSGHAKNQSILHPLIRPGYDLLLERKEFPTGEKVRIT
jgi:hypothetical protein